MPKPKKEDGARTVISKKEVSNYLKDHYPVDETQANNLVNKYAPIVEDGINMRSFISFVGDKIADKENMSELELPDDDDEEED